MFYNPIFKFIFILNICLYVYLFYLFLKYIFILKLNGGY